MKKNFRIHTRKEIFCIIFVEIFKGNCNKTNENLLEFIYGKLNSQTFLLFLKQKKYFFRFFRIFNCNLSSLTIDAAHRALSWASVCWSFFVCKYLRVINSQFYDSTFWIITKIFVERDRFSWKKNSLLSSQFFARCSPTNHYKSQDASAMATTSLSRSSSHFHRRRHQWKFILKHHFRFPPWASDFSLFSIINLDEFEFRLRLCGIWDHESMKI